MKRILVFQILSLIGFFPLYSQMWVQRGDDLDGEAVGDHSGSSVSISSDGNVLAIGAIANNDAGEGSGQVRVYYWDGSSWIQRGTDIDGINAGDQSGRAVSLSSDGSILAIGAPYHESSSSVWDEDQGMVRIFEWNGSSWIQRGTDLYGEDRNDHSGNAVCLSSDGNILAIGAPNNGDGGFESGHVRVYQWNGETWTQMGEDLNGESDWDNAGSSVSLSSDGNILAVGAPGNKGTGNVLDAMGSVRVYFWNGSSWVQRGNDIDGEEAHDQSGYSVSLNSDGSILAVGALNNDSNGNSSGQVKMFRWNGEAWIQQGTDIIGENYQDFAGCAISLNSDGNSIAIGADGNDGRGSRSGHVRVYGWDGLDWELRGWDIDGEAEDDRSGSAVSINSDGNVVAIGAPNNDGSGENSGQVRVYTFDEDSLKIRDSLSITFPDQAFRNALIEAGIDYNGDGLISYAEAEATDSLNVSNKDIRNMTGLESFIHLKKLICGENFSLSDIDLNNCDSLTYLDCYGMNLDVLDLSNCRLLTYLDCGWNDLNNLNINHCNGLKYLDCHWNNLASLEITNKPDLETIICRGNQLTSLNLAGNSALEYLACSDNQIPALDVSASPLLWYFESNNNQITNIDLSQNSELEMLYLNQNQLTSIDVSKHDSLRWFLCNSNKLTSLDVTRNSALTLLACADNQLSGIDVSHNTLLTKLYCGINSIDNLDIRQNTYLEELICHENQLTTLDVSKNTAMKKLNCRKNLLTELDISANTALESINIEEMPTLQKVCVWEVPFPPQGVEFSMEGSPNVYFSTECATGIEEYTTGHYLIYPNPAIGLLTIQSEKPVQYSLEITSLNGQLLLSKQMEGTSNQIDLSSFQKGVYIITIRSKGYATTRKIVKF